MAPRSPEPAPLEAPAFAELMVPFGLERGAHVAVAVSGGADSLCLATLLAEWAKDNDVRVTALTVDHRLRAEARAEAAQVAAWMAARGVAHETLTWADGPATRSAVQARARDARYGLLTDWCAAHGAGHLFVAHHLGDQAETFVMRLKRASTLFGLAAMVPVREWGGIKLCRPLLGMPKERLEATLLARGLDWIEDPSNTDRTYERVRTRALIAALQAEGVSPERLAGAARGARALTAVLDRAVAAFERDAIGDRADGGADIDLAAFAELPQPVAERALSRVLQRLGRRNYPPSPAKVARVRRWLALRSQGARTLGGCLVRVRGDAVIVTREPPRRAAKPPAGRFFFTPQPLPRGGKSLTSQALVRAQVHTHPGEVATKC